LASVEERYLAVINENCMVGEDIRSIAYSNFEENLKLSQTLQQ